jgi:protein gp37
MSQNSKIEWTDHTFNPWEGCQKISPGCDHCYAETRNARFAGGTAVNWGPGAPRRRTSAANWRKPIAWNAAQAEFFAAHGRRQRVFCASLADVFDTAVDPAWRRDLFDLIELTPHLDWLLLTKRVGNVARLVADARTHDWLDGRDNVWIGASIVNQEEADRDIPKLLALPARVRFLSIEPLLEPINISRYMWPMHWSWDAKYKTPQDALAAGAHAVQKRQALVGAHCQFLDWVIVGGESGPQARPMHPGWARSLRDQCTAAGVPYLFKQWGEWRPAATAFEATNTPMIVTNRSVAATTPESRAFRPMSGCFHMTHQVESMLDGSGEYAHLDCAMFKAGKKSAGRDLDGIQHDGYPK